MDWPLTVTQFLNGVQLGVLLFLLAAGLTLVFGIMDFVNLAHGSLYMIGAFFCATMTLWWGSFPLAVLLTLPATLLVGIVVEVLVVRHLYQREHLDQVLATFGLILVFDTGVHLIWGPEGLTFPLPEVLNGQVTVLPGIEFPIYRLLIIATGLLVAGGLYLVITRTRIGMLIRAGASNRTMVGALGVDIKSLYTLVFAAGAVLAGLAGLMIAPITEASIGMGNDILIVAFVVIIIGGIGSIRGAFLAAMIVGLIDTLGRSFLDDFMKLFLSNQVAETSAPALSAMLIYILMAGILYFRPQGLFPPRGHR
ncbi:MAG: branched-chain amino acid ABC transporter permease [Gammaproteobacteria bacterium]|nr:branched-chain amino acid ABC transporter permease [Gammaproteobacteria bacterium]